MINHLSFRDAASLVRFLYVSTFICWKPSYLGLTVGKIQNSIILRKELKINWTSVSIVTGGVEVLVDLWLSRRLSLGLVWVNF